MRAADHVIDMGPGAGEHGGGWSPRAPRKQVMRPKRSITGAYLSGRRSIPVPDRRIARRRLVRRARRAEHNLKDIDVELPVGKFICVTGVSGSGKSTLVNEVIFKSLANRVQRTRVKPGAHREVFGFEAFDKVIDIDQSPIGRTPRSNPATYTGLFDHIRDLYAQTPDAKARGLQAGPLLVQRQGRALRDLPRRRHDQDRDALPARRVHQLRGLPRPPLQPGDAGGAVQGQVDRRRAGDADRGGARVLRQDPEAPPPAADAARRRPRLHAARPAGDDALRRRGAAGQAGDRAVEGGDRADAVHPRRADHRPARRTTSRSCWSCCSGWSTPATRCS